MSEPIHDETAEAELPRLRIHHFFVLTTVFAVVMSAHLGILHLIRSLYPDAEIPKLTTGKSLIYLVYTFPQSACIAIALLGLTWRRQGISFPCQPGHWIALYLTIVGAYEIALTFLSIFPVAQTFGFDPKFWLTRPMSLVFHCFAVALWGAAYLHEPSRIWKLGWVAMASKSLLLVLWPLLHIGAKCVEWLLDVSQYNSQFDGDFFFLLGPWERIIAKSYLAMLSTYALIFFLPVAAIIDLRQQRQRHWSHWLVVVSTFVSTVILTVYYHIALR